MFNNRNVFLTLTYKCNAFCKKCMTRYHKNRNIELSKEVLDRVLFLLKRNNYSGVISVGTGEPLLYNDFNYFYNGILSINPRIRMRLLTNGMLLNPETPHIFNDRCIWGVTMDAFEQDSLLNLQRGVDIERVKYNVSQAANKYGGSKLYLNFTVYQTNVDEILPFVKFAVENGINDIYLTELKVFSGYEKDLSDYMLIRNEHFESVIQQAKSYLVERGISPRGIEMESSSGQKECYLRNSASPIIDVDGNVSFCCGREDVYIGNILNEEIEQLWASFKERVSNSDIKWCTRCLNNSQSNGIYTLPKTIIRRN